MAVQKNSPQRPLQSNGCLSYCGASNLDLCTANETKLYVYCLIP